MDGNLDKILELANDCWSPNTQRYILNFLSNLPSSRDNTIVLESLLYETVIHASYTNESEVRELGYALINLLMPIIGDNFLLYHYGCP